MSITVSASKTLLENRKKDIGDVGNSVFVNWANFVNRRMWSLIQDIDPERIIASTTISVTSVTETYALPADFNNIRPFGCGFYLQDSNAKPIPTPLAKTRYRSDKTGYFITGSNVTFTPDPGSSDIYTLRYIANLTNFTVDNIDTDEYQISDEFQEFILEALDVCYSIWDEDQNAEILADERFIRALGFFAQHIRTEPHSIFLPDFSTIY